MKNAFLTIAIMALVAASVTGCDFFRRLAGRPDSEWIEAKAETIRQEEETQRIVWTRWKRPERLRRTRLPPLILCVLPTITIVSV